MKLCLFVYRFDEPSTSNVTHAIVGGSIDVPIKIFLKSYSLNKGSLLQTAHQIIRNGELLQTTISQMRILNWNILRKNIGELEMGLEWAIKRQSQFL